MPFPEVKRPLPKLLSWLDVISETGVLLGYNLSPLLGEETEYFPWLLTGDFTPLMPNLDGSNGLEPLDLSEFDML